MNTNYNFAVLDPRNIPAAVEGNEKVFENPVGVLGIEVTIPALASRCSLGNIDPQHDGSGSGLAAIEVAMTCPLPPDGATLATVRPDLDAFGSMAILAIRAKYPKTRAELSLARASGGSRWPAEAISLIASADKFARGGYPGPKALPTRDNPWTEENASAESSRPLAAIAAAVMDFKVPLAARVETMEKWLLTGEEPASYRASVEKERLDMIVALENGTIKHETRAGGKIAVVESTHRAATSVGYSLAPIVVALNPTFKQGPGDAYKKFTICAFEAKFADIKSALGELNELEAGWGGSPTIGGSPQGVRSVLTIDQVVEVVQRHLKK